MKVNEIFCSLQGEGRWTGTPAVFLRLSGCNLRCHFCDTTHETGVEMSVADILSDVSRFGVKHIVITGGEPTMQINGELLTALKNAGFFVQIETNGSVELYPDLYSLIDWITCSPKGAPLKLQRIDELKVLFHGAGCDVTAYERLIEGPLKGNAFLQPCDCGDPCRNHEIIAATIDYILSHPVWRLSLQTHKMLDIR